MGLSRRAYGRHRGVSLAAVQKALRAGRITLLPDGTIDPEASDKTWNATAEAAPIPPDARTRFRSRSASLDKAERLKAPLTCPCQR